MNDFTSDQEQAINNVKKWFNEAKNGYYTIGGYAGTGKSFIIPYIIQELGLEESQVAIAAFTGKASLILTKKRLNATTIHRLLYYPEVHKVKNGEDVVTWKKKHCLDKSLKLIIIDEASMVSENIHNDLMSYNKKILYIGDCFQLPPINSDFSLMNEGKINCKLNQICRQVEGNNIIQISLNIRKNIPIHIGDYGSIKKIGISNVSYKDFLEYDQIICGTNKNRMTINQIIRKLKGFSDIININEKIIVNLNNYQLGVINGQQIYIQKYKLNQHSILIKYKDDIENDITENELSYCNFKLEYDEKEKSKKRIYGDYGYCITAHKAQGSEWDKVVVYDDGFGFDEVRRRWIYTAITRGKKEVLWIVK